MTENSNSSKNPKKILAKFASRDAPLKVTETRSAPTKSPPSTPPKKSNPKTSSSS